MKNLVISIFLTSIIFNFVGCNNEEDKIQYMTDHVETELFLFEVNYPSFEDSKSLVELKGKLTYKGEEDSILFHGKPLIRFIVLNEDGEIIIDNSYEDIEITTTLKHGEVIEVTDHIKIDKKGTYKIIGFTTGLELNGEYLLGTGNDFFIKMLDDKSTKPSERIYQIENSRLTIDSISIEIK